LLVVIWQPLVLAGILGSAAACVAPAEPYRPWIDVTLRPASNQVLPGGANATVSIAVEENGELVEVNESSVVLERSASLVTLRVELSFQEPPIAAAWIDLDGNGAIDETDLITPDFVEIGNGELHVIEVAPRGQAASFKALGPKVGSS
jgi:hypothetical protein